MSESGSSTAGASFWSMLQIAFIVLKLCGTIDWSWWLVMAPMWGPAAIAGTLALAFGVIYCVVYTVFAVIDVGLSAYKKVKENRR